MELKLISLPARGPCIQLYGKWVTPVVWRAVNAIMKNNDISSREYKARNAVNAFFQGGFDKPDGNWVLIEFWSHDEKKLAEFTRLLTAAVGVYIDHTNTHIEIHNSLLRKHDLYHRCVQIADENDCAWVERESYFVFVPTDNVKYEKVAQALRHFPFTVDI